jgi:hypothetical protein
MKYLRLQTKPLRLTGPSNGHNGLQCSAAVSKAVPWAAALFRHRLPLLYTRTPWAA